MQKTDLIAELKRTKDIPGIKKLKVERAQVEKTQEQNMMSEINKAFSVTNFVDQVSYFVLHSAFFGCAHKSLRETREIDLSFTFTSPYREERNSTKNSTDFDLSHSPLFTDPGERQFGKRDTDLEAADAGAKSCRTSEEGTRGANSERERGEAAESDPTVEAATPRQEG